MIVPGSSGGSQTTASSASTRPSASRRPSACGVASWDRAVVGDPRRLHGPASATSVFSSTPRPSIATLTRLPGAPAAPDATPMQSTSPGRQRRELGHVGEQPGDQADAPAGGGALRLAVDRR